MTDILEERERRVQEALVALSGIIQHLSHRSFMGPGKIKVVSENPNYHSYHIEIPIKVEDYFVWEEILHDGS